MKVLIACEFSGIVRDAFKKRGHNVWSCDILPTDLTGNHIQDDVLNILNDGWDLMIAHPPCTYICAGSMNWLYRETGRYKKMLDAIEFIKKLLNAPIDKIALENPIGLISSKIRKPNQIIRAYYFGEPYKKDICLWLKNLPKLIHIKETDLFDVKTHANQPYKTFDFWSTDRYTEKGESKKSITFQGVAKAMAEQWG